MTYRSARTSLLWLALCLATAVVMPQAWGQRLPDFTDLVERVRPGVVNVSAVGPGRGAEHPLPEVPDDESLRRFFEDHPGEIPPFGRDSQGSGFIVSADGYVVTNSHVVRDAERIVVRLSDRREFDAELIGTDRDSDMALLKIEAEDLPVVRVGDSRALKVGEWVLAIGSPFGFEHSVTAGIVSAIGRTLPNENYVPFIQTDVAINPGNSGGPLFNMDGEVVGVNSQIFSRTGGYMGLSFAIPIDMAMDVVEQLKTTGTVARGWLGVYIQDVTRELAESFGMDRPHGALVARVMDDSPADRGELRAGDVIVRYDGHKIERSAAVPPLVGRTPPGKKVRIELIRDGERQRAEVVIGELAERRAEASPEASREPRGGSYNSRLALSVRGPTPQEREALELGESGVIVEEVGDGAARRAGLREGDAVVMIGGGVVGGIADFERLVRRLRAGHVVPVLVHREGGPLFLPLKLPAK
ncbi:MAG: Do family serine endopeptidase [Gammaproteobacteria bacterium]|nr:Do family serine endopeptidase [Gammaproteobacteria bacterium]NIR32876.1 Do family serine endopeptidase [Gammaproteobacteria bacterium]NIR99422.1 Do family serine endopeptidase [Gammaproteobacteria bacterium]NIT65036.1 Do family serine endopeptidase [Gammaproteobacteria bacterium]NIV21951.1 Do family serine endopeptidase [Gammaproteobacteria bacterium]